MYCELKGQSKDAIYSILCNDYIYCYQDYRQTKCQFHTSLKDHQKSWSFQEKKVWLCRSTYVTMQSENFKMITTNPCYHERHLEALHILIEPTLNDDDGSLLPKAYLHLVNNRWCHHRSLRLNLELFSQQSPLIKTLD